MGSTPKYLVLSFLVFILYVLTVNSEEMVLVPMSCNGLEDGEYIMRLVDAEEYPLVTVRCSNEFIIINPQNDIDSWSKYFLSFTGYHYQSYGPVPNDKPSWSQWFIPTKDHLETDPDIEFLVSPLCKKCDINIEENQFEYLSLSGYYGNPLGTQGFAGPKHSSCDMDWDTYQCKLCVPNVPQAEEWAAGTRHCNLDGLDPNSTIRAFHDRELHPNWLSIDRKLEDTYEKCEANGVAMGNCYTEIRNALNPFPSYDFHYTKRFLPMIGTQGKFCQCVKPNALSRKTTPHTRVSKSQYNHYKLANTLAEKTKIKTNSNDHDITDIYYLYQSDFEVGTYRITVPGTYIIMEDIEFNFNAPPNVYDLDSPNDVEQEYWWPPSNTNDTCNELLDNCKYPGAGYTGRGPYMLGYFAGITIETHDVILDLNQHCIQQHLHYYYQQPFFALIELESQPFLPHQGNGFFGALHKFAENVVIKDGVLGLSSHHGIHGNRNKNIVIKNIKVRNFFSHGIQLNGFDNLHLESIEIGPTTHEAYLNHNYGELRLLLPYLKLLAYDHPTDTIQFDATLRDDGGGPYTMDDLIEKLIASLDKVFKYVIDPDFDANGGEFAELISNDPDFKLFCNLSGYPFGAVVYGLYLNYEGVGIFGWDTHDASSTNAYLKDIYIHDMYHDALEVIAFRINEGRIFVTTLLSSLNVLEMFGGDYSYLLSWIMDDFYPDPDKIASGLTPHYIGSLATDIYFAMMDLGGEREDKWWISVPYYGSGNCLIEWSKATSRGFDCMTATMRGVDQRWTLSTNMDGMLHTGKGLLALKITNGVGIQFAGEIRVTDLFSVTKEGYEEITKAEGLLSTHEPNGNQQPPYQAGYSMSQLMGITIEMSEILVTENTNIEISNLESKSGRVLGFASWFTTNITFMQNTKVNIKNIDAGSNVDKNKYEYSSSANRKAEACSFWKYDFDLIELTNSKYWDLYQGKWKGEINMYDESVEMSQSCVRGNTGCLGNDTKYTLYGVVNSDASQCNYNSKEFETESIISNIEISNYPYFVTGITLIVLLSIYVIYVIYAWIYAYGAKYVWKNDKKLQPNVSYGTFL